MHHAPDRTAIVTDVCLVSANECNDKEPGHFSDVRKRVPVL